MIDSVARACKSNKWSATLLDVHTLGQLVVGDYSLNSDYYRTPEVSGCQWKKKEVALPVERPTKGPGLVQLC